MPSQTDPEQPVSTGSPSPQQAAPVSTQSPELAGTSKHGASGEGAGSAMARLISQEKARIVPGAPPSEPTGGA